MLLKNQNCSNESFTELVKLLVNESLKQCTRNDGNNNINVQRLKAISLRQNVVFETIFSHRKEYYSSLKEDKYAGELNELEKIIWHSHVLRKRRLFDRAIKLEKFIEALNKKGHLDNQSDVRCVLQLLSFLIDNGPKESSYQLSTISPWVVSASEDENTKLPQGPLNYNDSRLHEVTSRFHYTHFPFKLFEPSVSIAKPPMESPMWETPLFNECYRDPGMGFRFPFIQNESQESCLGALIGPKKSPMTPDTALSIPDLPSFPEGYSIVPTFLSTEMKSTLNVDCNNQFYSRSGFRDTPDEGYGSSQQSCKSPRGADPIDIWEEVLKGDPLPQRHRWESLGEHFAPLQKPFLSEAGKEVTHKLWVMGQDVMCCFKGPSEWCEVSSKVICSHIVHLLMGLPSTSFPRLKNSFILKPGLCYKGTTPESFSAMVRDFIICGNQVKRLEELCSDQVTSSENSRGLVTKAFIIVIRNFLHIHRSHTYSLMAVKRVLQLRLQSDSLRKKVSFMYFICSSAGDSYGLHLIGNLKAELMITQHNSNYLLLLSLLNATSQPLFRILEGWIYKGMFYDPYDEFMIKVNPEVLSMRDRSYWVEGYTMHDLNDRKVPQFLRKLLSVAFLCGKSLNFLRVCSPQKYFFSHDVNQFPQMRLCISVEQVEKVEQECCIYDHHMRDTINIKSLTNYTVEQEQKRQEIIKTIASNRINTIEKLKTAKEALAAQVDSVKREAMEERRHDIERMVLQKEAEHEEELRVEKRVLLEQIQMEETKRQREHGVKKAFEEKHNKGMCDLEQREKVALDLLSPTDQREALDLLSPISTEGGSRLEFDLDEASSQMSLSSDLQTPLNERLPELIIDNRLEPPKNFKAKVLKEVYGIDITETKDLNSNLENDGNGNTQTPIKETTEELNGNKIVSRRPCSQLVESDNLLQPINRGTSMKKSKSDCFPTNSLQSNFFNANESPILTTPDWSVVRTTQPITNFRDQELLNARLLEPSSSLPDFQQSGVGTCVGKSFFSPRPSAQEEKETFHHLLHAPIFFVKALSAHIELQTRLVNDALVSFFLTELPLLRHLDAIKSLVLMQDVSFARSLATHLFRMENVSSIQGFNVAELNGSLNEALSASCFAESPFARNLFFLLPSNNNSDKCKEEVELRYRVEWPINVIIDQKSSDSLVVIWRFLLRLHYVTWALDDVFRKQTSLGNDPWFAGLKASPEFHQASIFRFKMHQFIRIVMGYVSHQGIEGGWAVLKESLKSKISTFQDLHSVFGDFVDSVIRRCFLYPNSFVIQKLLSNIFDAVLLFRQLILNHQWRRRDPEINCYQHPKFDQINKVFAEFSNSERLFTKLLVTISNWTRSDYIEDLVCQLNFNENYSREQK